uniref:Antitoxin n=1 Tax=Bosea sp. NBC_00436 TaxID=2969620 RepID=A0A9E7ZUZ1_9HYPH
MDDRRKPIATGGLLDLDPALREMAKRWFAEAREQTKRDDEDIAAWQQRCSDRTDGIGGPYFTDLESD